MWVTRFRRRNERHRPAAAAATVEAAPHGRPPARAKLRDRAARARREALLVTPFVIATLLVYRYRETLFNLDEPVRLACALALVGLGWWLARDIGRAVRPAL